MTTSSIEQRLRRLEDELALRTLMNKYHWYPDHYQWDNYRELWTKDMEFEVVSANRKYVGINEAMVRLRAGLEDRYEDCQHAIVNKRFEFIDDNHANGFGNLIFVGVPKKSEPNSNYMSGGRYRWEFVRTSNGWRISKSSIEFIWESNDVAASNFFKTPEIPST
ncbi:MAG: nuclear transport factor 2 family protein [Spongiibacteraceae bacterium]